MVAKSKPKENVLCRDSETKGIEMGKMFNAFSAYCFILFHWKELSIILRLIVESVGLKP